MSFGNQLLDTLDPDDLAALKPYLRRMPVAAGQVLIEQDGDVTDVHFPVDAQLVNLVRFDEGQAIETAVIGTEGLSGLSPFLAGLPCGWEVAARTPGLVYALPARVLRDRHRISARLLERLLQLSSVYQMQSVQQAACNATHRALPRVARWLLTTDDLSPEGPLRFTQEELAALLGAQRTTVNDAASQLKAMGAIRYSRGTIEILDRGALKGAACECYAMMRARMERAGVLQKAG